MCIDNIYVLTTKQLQYILYLRFCNYNFDVARSLYFFNSPTNILFNKIFIFIILSQNMCSRLDNIGFFYKIIYL